MSPFPRTLCALVLAAATASCATTAPTRRELALDPALTSNKLGGSAKPLGNYSSPQGRPDQGAKCSVALAFAGGGTVSASMAFGFMERFVETMIESGDSQLLNEIDYVTTASGGGHAAYLFIDMLREARVRNPSNIWGEVKDSMASPRFRSSLSTIVLPSYGKDAIRFGVAALLFDSNGKEMHRRLVSAVASGDTMCTHKGPIAQTPPGKDDVLKCRVFEDAHADVLRPSDFVAKEGSTLTHPVWLPAFTLFDAGVNVPFSPAALELLGVESISFSKDPDDVHTPVAEMSMIDALVLSSAFPGIGPFLFRTKDKDVIVVADGGQTDNLGIENAAILVSNDIAAGATAGVVITVDTSTEPSNHPFFQDRKASFADRISLTATNAVPLLKHARRQQLALVRAVDRDEKIALHSASIDDVLKKPLPFFNLRGGDCPIATPIAQCPRDTAPKSMDVWQRAVVDTFVAEALPRQVVEDLIVVGRAMFDNHASKIRESLQNCRQASEPAAATPAPPPTETAPPPPPSG